MGPDRTARRVLLAFIWSAGCVLVLATVDGVARTPSSSAGSELILVLAALSIGLSFLVLKVAGLGAARAVSLGSLPTVAALVPCMLRLIDSPLVSVSPNERPAIYPGSALVGLWVITFVAVFLVQRGTEPTLVRDPKVDYRHLGMVVAPVVALTPLLVSSWLPALRDLADVEVYADVAVPALDAGVGDSADVFADEKVVLSVVRTHALPLRVARLELDLHDGVGERPVVAVGGGEHLQLVHRGELVWELRYDSKARSKRTGAHEYVVLRRFLKGAASDLTDLRVSHVRGKLAPPASLVSAGFIALLGAAVALLISERRRRTLLRVMRGKLGTMAGDGQIEALGQSYTLATPPRHHWPGPVVLLDVEENDPYRGTRTARTAVPGTIEQHVAWHAHQRAALHAVMDIAWVLVVLHLVTAAVVGYWGF